MSTDTIEAPIEIHDGLDEAAWLGFVDSQSHSNIFHTPQMYRVFAGAQGHRPSLWAATDRSGLALALLVPVEVTVVGGVLRRWTSRSVVYGGVLCAGTDLGRRAVALLLRAYAGAVRKRVPSTELRHLSGPDELRPALAAAGFAHEDHLNYLIALDRPADDLWSALSRTARQRARSGRKKGVVVEEVADEDSAEEVYRLLEHVYRRAGVPLAGRSLFRAALSELAPQGMLRIFVARLHGRVIGSRFLLMYKDRIYDWYAGSDRAFASHSPNEVLVWHVLRWGQEHGFKIFDFGGAGRPGERYGPREFKSKFGGQIVNFGRDVLVHAPLRYRLSRMGYAATRRLLWGDGHAPRGGRA